MFVILVLAQVEISENEQQKIQEIECIRENLLESTKSALHIVTGLNNDLSRLQVNFWKKKANPKITDNKKHCLQRSFQGRYMNALEECLKWEKSITVTKNFMTRNEMTTNCMLDAINHLYILISKRRGGPCKYVRGDVERQLDFIKEEAGIMQEIHSIAHKKLAKDDLSLIAEKGSIKTKPIIFPAKTKGFRKIAQ